MILKTVEPMVRLSHAEGVWVFDTDGRRYLDLYGGHAVCSIGHAHPRWVAAIRDQAQTLSFYSTAAALEVREAAARALATPRHPKVFFVNSGAEAVENALKLATLVTGRRKFISMKGCFHGRTAGAWALKEATAEMGGPVAVDRRTAAVIVEPIQSMAGVRTAPPEFFLDRQSLLEHPLGSVQLPARPIDQSQDAAKRSLGFGSHSR